VIAACDRQKDSVHFYPLVIAKSEKKKWLVSVGTEKWVMYYMNLMLGQSLLWISGDGTMAKPNNRLAPFCNHTKQCYG